MDVQVKRTKIKPLYDMYGSHEEYYTCPCGKDCIRRKIDGRLGMGNMDFFVAAPCSEKYTSVRLDNRLHVFHLQEKDEA